MRRKKAETLQGDKAEMLHVRDRMKWRFMCCLFLLPLVKNCGKVTYKHLCRVVHKKKKKAHADLVLLMVVNYFLERPLWRWGGGSVPTLCPYEKASQNNEII